MSFSSFHVVENIYEKYHFHEPIINKITSSTSNENTLTFLSQHLENVYLLQIQN